MTAIAAVGGCNFSLPDLWQRGFGCACWQDGGGLLVVETSWRSQDFRNCANTADVHRKAAVRVGFAARICDWQQVRMSTRAVVRFSRPQRRAMGTALPAVEPCGEQVCAFRSLGCDEGDAFDDGSHFRGDGCGDLDQLEQLG